MSEALLHCYGDNKQNKWRDMLHLRISRQQTHAFDWLQDVVSNGLRVC